MSDFGQAIAFGFLFTWIGLIIISSGVKSQLDRIERLLNPKDKDKPEL